METKDESRLLALPLELITRITDSLRDESLPSLRLTCKTLEGATFDRFVKIFHDIYCCIYYESRWLSLQRFLNGSPRLVKALRFITFTDDPQRSLAEYQQVCDDAGFQQDTMVLVQT